jgi:hypothetical protein
MFPAEFMQLKAHIEL